MFGVFTAILCFLALWEYFHIVYNLSDRPVFDILPVLGYFTGPAIVFAAYHQSFQGVISLITVNILLCGLVTTFRYKSDPLILEAVFKQVQGIVYIPVLISYLTLIRNSPEGIFWIFFLLLLVAAADTGAYYIGTWFGKHKLCPSVSPGKTVEGFIGGLAALSVAGTAFKWYVFPQFTWGITFLLFLSIGLIGPLGDLFESVLKRSSKVKDSGSLLPGHGGILDRIDALLFAAPVAYLFKEYLL